MSRAGRQISLLPHKLLLTHIKLDHTTIHHDILMLKPIPIPLLTIDFHRLNIVPILPESPRIAITPNPQRSIAVHGHVDVVEPRRLEKIHGLRHDRVQAEHGPYEPGVGRAGVAVSRDAVEGVLEVLVGEGAGLVDGFVRFVEVVVEVREAEVGFVPVRSVDKSLTELVVVSLVGHVRKAYPIFIMVEISAPF